MKVLDGKITGMRFCRSSVQNVPQIAVEVSDGKGNLELAYLSMSDNKTRDAKSTCKERSIERLCKVLEVPARKLQSSLENGALVGIPARITVEEDVDEDGNTRLNKRLFFAGEGATPLTGKEIDDIFADIA